MKTEELEMLNGQRTAKIHSMEIIDISKNGKSCSQ